MMSIFMLVSTLGWFQLREVVFLQIAVKTMKKFSMVELVSDALVQAEKFRSCFVKVKKRNSANYFTPFCFSPIINMSFGVVIDYPCCYQWTNLKYVRAVIAKSIRCYAIYQREDKQCIAPCCFYPGFDANFHLPAASDVADLAQRVHDLLDLLVGAMMRQNELLQNNKHFASKTPIDDYIRYLVDKKLYF
jgi:hypothetical protein